MDIVVVRRTRMILRWVFHTFPMSCRVVRDRAGRCTSRAPPTRAHPRGNTERTSSTASDIGSDRGWQGSRGGGRRIPAIDPNVGHGPAVTRPLLEIVIAGRTHAVECLPGETIFRAAHRSELAPPFSCIAGYCGECVATLEEGDVEMKINRALSPRQLGRGLILTCQAVPRTARCRVRFGD